MLRLKLVHKNEYSRLAAWKRLNAVRVEPGKAVAALSVYWEARPLIADPPGSSDFRPFSGVDRNRGKKLSPDSSAMPFCTMQDDKIVNSLDMSPIDNYARAHVTNRLANSPAQGCGLIFTCDAIPGKISPCISTP